MFVFPLQSLINLTIRRESTSSAAWSPQRPFCALQELVAAQEVGPGASRMIYGSVSWVVAGPRPTIMDKREALHCMAQSAAAQNFTTPHRHYNACHRVVWMGREAAVKQLGERTTARDHRWQKAAPTDSVLLSSPDLMTKHNLTEELI